MPIKYQKEIDNNPQSQTSPPFSYILMRFLKDDITLLSSLAEDATTATLSSGHGFTGASGEHILIYENDHFLQQEVIPAQISGDVITLTTPVDIPFTTDAIVVRGNINLNIDFSSVEEDVTFEVLDGVIPVDIEEIELIFSHSQDSDDGKFGGGAALTKGSYFRQVDGRRINLGNYKKNLDFRTRGAMITYNQKAPSGAYSTIITFDLVETFGQALRIDPRKKCSFVSHFRDSLTGNSSFIISLNGSYTSGE